MKNMQANILDKVTTQADMDHQKEMIRDLETNMDSFKEDMEKFKRDNNFLQIKDLSSQLNQFKLTYQKDKAGFEETGRKTLAISQSIELQAEKHEQIVESLTKNLESEDPLS